MAHRAGEAPPANIHRAGILTALREIGRLRPLMSRGPRRGDARCPPVAREIVNVAASPISQIPRQQVAPHHQARAPRRHIPQPQVPAQRPGRHIDMEPPPNRGRVSGLRNGTGIERERCRGGEPAGQGECPQCLARVVNADIPDIGMVIDLLEKSVGRGAIDVPIVIGVIAGVVIVAGPPAGGHGIAAQRDFGAGRRAC